MYFSRVDSVNKTTTVTNRYNSLLMKWINWENEIVNWNCEQNFSPIKIIVGTFSLKVVLAIWTGCHVRWICLRHYVKSDVFLSSSITLFVLSCNCFEMVFTGCSKSFSIFTFPKREEVKSANFCSCHGRPLMYTSPSQLSENFFKAGALLQKIK